LQQVIEKWPDANRAGCAAMYLGQMMQGDDQQKYLKLGMDKYANTFYGDGVQVGAYARYTLGMVDKEQGNMDEARKVFDEMIKKYPDAIDHHGDSLAKAVEDVMPPKGEK
jgi:Tetratricopeptide repeat